MKKTLITLLALSGIAMGETAGTTTLTPMTDTENWTKVYGGTLNHTNQTLVNTVAWYLESYSYALGDNAILLDTEGDSLTFSYQISSSNSANDYCNFGATVALEGATNAIVSGKGKWGSSTETQSALTTTTNSRGYVFQSTNGDYTLLDADNATIATIAGGVNQTNSPTTITGTIAWSDEAGQFQLTLSTNTAGIKSSILNVGTTVDVDTIQLSVIGKKDTTILSALSVSTTLDGVTAVPEPTTATLSLLALAGLAARRRRK